MFKFLKLHPVIRWSLVAFFAIVAIGGRYVASIMKPTAPTDNQVELMKANATEQISKFPESVVQAATTKSCVVYLLANTPWPGVLANLPDVKGLMSLASCSCMMNSVSKLESYKTLEASIAAGTEYGAAIDKFNDMTPVMMAACAQ